MGTRVPYDRVLKTKIKLNVIELGMNEELHELEIQNKIKTKTFFFLSFHVLNFPTLENNFSSTVPYHIVP